MFFNLVRDTTSSLSVTEISDETVHAEIPYSGWRNMIVNMIWRIVSAGRRKKQNSRTWDILPAVSVWRSFGREIRPDPRLNGRTRPFTRLRKPEETAS